MFVALGLAAFCGALYVVVLGPFLPAMSRDLAVGVPLLGQAPALANFVAAALGLLIGPLAERFGQRRTLVLGLLALAVGGLGAALAPGFLVLLAAVLVGAPARSIAMPVSQAIAGGAFAGTARQRAVGWTQAGVGASVTLGIPLLTTVDSLLGWRAALTTFAGLGLLAAVLAQLVLPAAPPRAAPLAQKRSGGRSAGRTGRRLGTLLAAYRPLLEHRPTVGLIASTVVGNTAISALLTYVGAFLIEQHGASAAEVGWAFSLSGGGLILGGILGARLARHADPRTLAFALMLLRGGVIAAMFLLPPGLPPGLPFGVPIATGLFGLLGLGDGVYLVSVVLALTGETPAGRALTMVLNGSAVALGNGLGSAIGGLLLALGGYPLLALYPPLAALAAALLIRRSGRRSGVEP